MGKGRNGHTYEDWCNLALKYNWIILEQKPEVPWRKKNKVMMMCPNGHQYKRPLECLNRARTRKTNKTKTNGCMICKTNDYDPEFIKSEIESRGYKLLDPFKKYNIKMRLLCPKNHIWEINYNRFQQSVIKGGRGCGVCAKELLISKGEKEVSDITESFGYKVIRNIRNIPNMDHHNPFNYEMDIWIPEHKKYIDYRGEYYHEKPDRVIIDKYKDQWCKDNGIQQLIIWDTEWRRNRDLITNKIKEFLDE